MKDIEEIRKQINEIDKQMAKLFEERMKASASVAEYKMSKALPILDEKREQIVINNNVKNIKNDDFKADYVLFIKKVMDISKDFQYRLLKNLKVAYSGIEGAFAHIASMKLFPNATYISYPSFEAAYKACVEGEVDTCILPLENSFAGDVGLVMDLLFSGSLYVNQVLELDVTHNLVAKEETTLEDITKVISHPQALDQCNDYLIRNGFEKITATNTAIAAKMVKESTDPTLAAVASIDTAKLYGLKVIAEHINSSNQNTTRFAAFSRVLNIPKENSMANHFILVFTVKNEAGSLAQTLNIIGIHGFNMRSLRSRPMKDLLWSYYFYAELEGDIFSNDGKEMLNELRVFCDTLKLIGTYRYHIEK